MDYEILDDSDDGTKNVATTEDLLQSTLNISVRFSLCEKKSKIDTYPLTSSHFSFGFAGKFKVMCNSTKDYQKKKIQLRGNICRLGFPYTNQVSAEAMASTEKCLESKQPQMLAQ